MSLFDDVFSSLSDEEQQHLQYLFQQWANCQDWSGFTDFVDCNHQRLLENLKNEHFLPKHSFKTLLDAFYTLRNNHSWPEILQHWRSMIRSNYQLQGDTIKNTPPVIGTALIKDYFVKFLINDQKFSKEEAKLLIEKKPDQFNAKDKRAFIKSSLALIWMTWDEFSHENPYNFLQVVSGNNVYISMALPDLYQNRELILFVFDYAPRQVSEYILHKPTWCDSNFFDKFCPTDPATEIRWGLTMPQQSYPIKPSYNPRRPEGVLRSGNLTISTLSTKIKPIPI